MILNVRDSFGDDEILLEPSVGPSQIQDVRSDCRVCSRVERNYANVRAEDY